MSDTKMSDTVRLFHEWFVEHYSKDLPGAKFKIGQTVTYEEEEYKVLAVCLAYGDNYEYSLDGLDWPILVWEHELEVVDG